MVMVHDSVVGLPCAENLCVNVDPRALVLLFRMLPFPLFLARVIFYGRCRQRSLLALCVPLR
jgi:hypothetical protein